MFGPGKYDDLCTYVREQVGFVEDDSDWSGGVVLIVFGGNRGDGMSVQADIEGLQKLPELLEDVANQLREDRKRVMT